MFFPFLSTQQIFYLWHKKIDKGTTSEVVEITSGESESEVRELLKLRNPGLKKEKESKSHLVILYPGHEQRTSVAPEGGKDQYNSGSNDDD